MPVLLVVLCCFLGAVVGFDCPDGYFPIADVYLCVGSQEEAGNGYDHNDRNCKSMNIDNGWLTQPRNAFKNTAFAQISLKKYGNVTTMIGAKRDDVNDKKAKYFYSDGSSVTYTNWAASEPAKGTGCVAIDTNGVWYGVSCDSKIPYLCQFTVQP
ncbi:unnamed protein product, partial [Mesorhabditis spiculigera]